MVPRGSRKDRIVIPEKPRSNNHARKRSIPTRPYDSEDRRVSVVGKRNPNSLKNWLERVDGRFFGSPIDVHPHEALQNVIRITAGELHYADQQVSRLYADELFEVPLRTVEIEMEGESEPFTRFEERRDPEIVSRWVRFRQDAADRLARYSKMALEVGIEERQIQLAESQAQQIVSIISAVLTDLGHDLKDFSTREIVRRRLMEGAIEGNTVETEREIA